MTTIGNGAPAQQVSVSKAKSAPQSDPPENEIKLFEEIAGNLGLKPGEGGELYSRSAGLYNDPEYGIQGSMTYHTKDGAVITFNTEPGGPPFEGGASGDFKDGGIFVSVNKDGKLTESSFYNVLDEGGGKSVEEFLAQFDESSSKPKKKNLLKRFFGLFKNNNN